MASRKSGSDFQNTGPLSYLEDVPFKLNDKFRCPAKVGLPIGFCLPDCEALLAEVQTNGFICCAYCWSEVISEVEKPDVTILCSCGHTWTTRYDFSLETRSVQWGEELADARAAQERARLRVEAALGESESPESLATATTVQDDGDPLEPRPSEEQDPPPPAINPVLAGLRHNAILTPLPAPCLGPVRQPTPPPHPPPQSLNLADFEREEDPFDKLELKTLDDKEELRSILQVQSSATPPEPAARSQGSTPPLTNPAPWSRSSTPPLPTTTTNPASKPALFHKPNGLVGFLDLDLPGGAGGGLGQVEADRPCNIRSLTFPKLSDPGDPPVDGPSYSTAPPRTLPNGAPLPSAGVRKDAGRAQDSLGRTAKEPCSVPTTGAVSPPDGGALECGALFSLSPAERQCVETIVGMGYSYEGVLKAMQRQGRDVEQVLEYLFVHSRLCERGFDSSAVEECLEMYQCSEEKALEFLQLMSRFGEMGFERDAIKEVLLVHDNDQDKALEDLMARAAAS